MNPMTAFWILVVAGLVFGAGVKIGSVLRSRAREMNAVMGEDQDMGTKP